MSSPQDYENDSDRSLRITDPSGNTSEINSATPCKTCGTICRYASTGECRGKTTFMNDVHEHVCEKHAQMGDDNRWYKSTPQKRDGLVQREIGGKYDK